MRLVFNYRPVNHPALHKPGPSPPPLRRLFSFSLSPLFLILSLATSRLSVLRPLSLSPFPSFSHSFARARAILSAQITPHDLRCNLQSTVRMYTAISPCKYATLFRMRMHSRLSTLSPFLLVSFLPSHRPPSLSIFARFLLIFLSPAAFRFG